MKNCNYNCQNAAYNITCSCSGANNLTEFRCPPAYRSNPSFRISVEGYETLEMSGVSNFRIVLGPDGSCAAGVFGTSNDSSQRVGRFLFGGGLVTQTGDTTYTIPAGSFYNTSKDGAPNYQFACMGTINIKSPTDVIFNGVTIDLPHSGPAGRKVQIETISS